MCNCNLVAECYFWSFTYLSKPIDQKEWTQKMAPNICVERIIIKTENADYNR